MSTERGASRLSTIPLVRFSVAEEDLLWRFVGLCERAAAIVLLVLLAPFLLAIAITTAVLSGRSPLIAHRRVGRCGAELWLLKFRTMWDRRGPRNSILVEHIADATGPEFKGPEDPRVRSRFARFCRRHSLDELPQLLHVAAGQMSLVGPRPVTEEELDLIYGPEAAEVLHSKPGMAGLWQVSGRNRLTNLQRRNLDLKLVRTRSLKLYVDVLLRTLPEVWNGANSW
jgi:lipopolysaccharide/colanic/teichoic acid biosynthesis glycosyltransferase